MKLMEAVRVATINSTRALKIDKDTDSLKPGKFADIIAIKSNPLEDIGCLQDKDNTVMVMKEGKVFAYRRAGHNKNVVNARTGDWKKVDFL